MTYPQQFAQPQAYAQPQPGFVQPPQYPAAPQYPQQPQQGFAPGYPAPTMAPPPQPLAAGTLADFYNQPTSAGSGPGWKFDADGVRYVGIVAREINSGDVRQQTTPPQQGSVPQFHKDGRPKFELRLPMKVQATQAFPEGRATCYVRGQLADELNRAMAEAGAPEGAPEAGAYIDVTRTHMRQGNGFTQKMHAVVYMRPGTFDPAQLGIVDVPVQTTPVQQYAQPIAQVPQQPVQYAPPVAQPAPVQQPLPTAPVAQAAPAAAPAGLPQRPPNLSDEQWAKLLELQGHRP